MTAVIIVLIIVGVLLFCISGLGYAKKSGKLNDTIEKVKKKYAHFKGKPYNPPQRI